jgi:hypothetical protein
MTHSILVNAEYPGDFLDPVGSMNLDEAMIWMAFAHGDYPLLLVLRPCGPDDLVPGGTGLMVFAVTNSSMLS